MSAAAKQPFPSAAEVVHGVEAVRDCRAEIDRMAAGHAQEFSHHLDQKGAPRPDWGRALLIERAGNLRICTARANGTLVGYFIMVRDKSPHFDLTLVVDDTFYLAPWFRPGWGLYRFLRFATEQMADFGGPGACLVVCNKIDQDLPAVWERLGFAPEEIRRTKMVQK